MGSVSEPAHPSPSPDFAHNSRDPQVPPLHPDSSSPVSQPEDPLHVENLPPSDPQQENSPNGENQQVPFLSTEENQAGEEAEGDDEEEGECGFCLFMKSGPCRDSFIKWEECVEEAEKAKEDIVAKCHQVTLLLKECMENHADYYEPVLKAEKEMTDAALEEEEATLQEGNAKKEPEVPRDNLEAGKEGNLSMQEAGEERGSSMQQTPIQNSEEASQASQ